MARPQARSSTRSVIGGGLVLGIALLVAGVVATTIFNFSFPFTTETKDHSPPLVLTELRDLAEFRAAEAEFEVIVDREKDVKWVPSFIAGERVQFVAVGTVEATVDFAHLTEDSISIDGDSNTAMIVLPVPAVGEPVVDMDRSGVMNRDRGVLDRLGGMFSDNPTAERSLILEAEDKMAAAVLESDLLARARANTEKMLDTLVRGLGFDGVRVVFEHPAA